MLIYTHLYNSYYTNDYTFEGFAEGGFYLLKALKSAVIGMKLAPFAGRAP